MAAIDDEIAALRAAIATGVKRVVTQTNGSRKEVEYQSIDQMKRALEGLEIEAGKRKGPRGVLAAF